MRKFLAAIFIIVFIGYLFFLLRPVLQNQLTGTFSNHTIPQSYQILAEKLAADKTFYRTFWVPTVPTYSFYSFTHPQVSAEDFLQVTDTASVLQFLQKSPAQTTLQNMGIKYIIVPIDSEKKIFLTERKYDNKQYLATISALQKIPWLHQVSLFGNLAVFRLDNAKEHFWLSYTGSLEYTMIRPTQYQVSLHTVQKGEKLIFAETFDPQWILQVDNKKIYTVDYNNMNSFALPQNGNYTLTMLYEPQKFIWYGAIISVVSIICLFLVLIYLSFTIYKNHAK